MFFNFERSLLLKEISPKMVCVGIPSDDLGFLFVRKSLMKFWVRFFRLKKSEIGHDFKQDCSIVFEFFFKNATLYTEKAV